MQRRVVSKSEQLTLPLGDGLKRVVPKPIIPMMKSPIVVPTDVGQPVPVAAPAREVLPLSHAERVLEAAHDYRRCGWPVIRLEGNQALDPDWAKITASSPMPAFQSDSNIGILLGRGLVALDPDWSEMCDALREGLAYIDCPRFGRASVRGCHHLFICDGLDPISFQLSAAMADDRRLPRLANGQPKLTLGKILSTGQHLLAPPSVHPDGERLTWENNNPTGVPVYQPAEVKWCMAVAAILAVARRLWPSSDAAAEQDCLVMLGRLLWQATAQRWPDSHTRHRFVYARIRYVVDMDLNLTAEVAGRDGIDETEGFCRAFQIPSEVATIGNWLNISTPLTPVHPSKGDGL